jgi:hypothetical protein
MDWVIYFVSYAMFVAMSRLSEMPISSEFVVTPTLHFVCAGLLK